MHNITKTLLISSITNTFLSILKIVVGFLGSSSALIADGIHSFSDLGTDFIAILGEVWSQKPADKEHPFGHGKIEYITSVIIGVVILILGGLLIYHALDTELIIPQKLTMMVSILTIIIKYMLASYISYNGKKYGNNILIASGQESKTDVYSSLCVLLSIVLMQFSDKFSILKYSNIIATTIIALFIIKTGYNILKENISVLLEQQVMDTQYIKKIRNMILSFDEIKEIKSLHILRYGPYYKMISTVVMDQDISLLRAHEVIDLLEEKVKEENVQYVFIHMEPLKAIDNL